MADFEQEQGYDQNTFGGDDDPLGSGKASDSAFLLVLFTFQFCFTMALAAFLIYRIVKWEEVDEETNEKKCTPSKFGIGVVILVISSFWMANTYGLIQLDQAL